MIATCWSLIIVHRLAPTCTLKQSRLQITFENNWTKTGQKVDRFRTCRSVVSIACKRLHHPKNCANGKFLQLVRQVFVPNKVTKDSSTVFRDRFSAAFRRFLSAVSSLRVAPSNPPTTEKCLPNRKSDGQSDETRRSSAGVSDLADRRACLPHASGLRSVGIL